MLKCRWGTYVDGSRLSVSQCNHPDKYKPADDLRPCNTRFDHKDP